MGKTLWLLGAGAGVVALAWVARPSTSKAKEEGMKPKPRPPSAPTSERYTRGIYTIEISTSSSGTQWLVFDTTGKLIGGGIEREAATAREFAEELVDGLHPLPPGPVKDGAALPSDPSVRRHGLLIRNCREIVVEDLVEWVAWAAPRLGTAALADSPSDAVGRVFAQGFPECASRFDLGSLSVERKIVGALHLRPLSAGISAIKDTLAGIRAGKAFVSTNPLDPSVIESAAALLLGRTLGRQAAPRFPHKGWIVEVGPFPGGGYGWSIRRPQETISRQGGAETEIKAIEAAKQAIT